MNKAAFQYVQLVYFYRLLLVRQLVLFNLVSLLGENLQEEEPSLDENENKEKGHIEELSCDQQVRRHHGDHLGSANYITDEKGKVFEHMLYLPYGEVWIDEGHDTSLLGYKFTGKELDEETGLTYYGARYLDSKFSSWISTDAASQHLNLYMYSRQNPVKFLDPDGLYDIETGAVESGDTLSGITKQLNEKYGTNFSYNDIAKFNSISDPDKINVGDNIKIGDYNKDGSTWQPPKDPKNVTEKYWDNLDSKKQKILHYHRNTYQAGQIPEKESQLKPGEWDNKGVAIAHNLAGASGNKDYRGVGDRAGQQAIFDLNGNQVKTPENMGTFDFVTPNESIKGHMKLDVQTWINWGNSPQDKTTRTERSNSIPGVGRWYYGIK